MLEKWNQLNQLLEMTFNLYQRKLNAKFVSREDSSLDHFQKQRAVPNQNTLVMEIRPSGKAEVRQQRVHTLDGRIHQVSINNNFWVYPWQRDAAVGASIESFAHREEE
mmetsp:Transcript_25221/g.36229  ORF Transcript_25221/g.36229 Transcript_25221/m.36229 type:complete len:108 (-) Transcript_25221:608-931(-)